MSDTASGHIPWTSISDTLLAKYGGQAPRYTSYPTAVEWNREFDGAAYLRALAQADQSQDDPLSVYVHIPFCIKRCHFCGCASDVSLDTEIYDTYLRALQTEIEAVSTRLPRRRKVTQLHFGGGTPTVLDSPRLARLVGVLKNAFDFSGVEEMALEAAPSVTLPEQIETLGRLGFNRVSFGVQDFTPEVQQAVDRVQSVEHTLALIEIARRLGYAVNLDLMYGLPRQRIDTWEENLKEVIRLKPNRLAVFGYAHVPWMRPHQQLMNEAELPDADLRLALFRTAHERLMDAGYVYIGMDHFALPDDTLSIALAEKKLSRNFQGYTIQQASALIGFGATAISDLGGAFAQNHPKTADYEAMAGTGFATFRGMKTSPEDRLRRWVITEIMCNLVLDFKEVENRFNIDFADHFKNERSGLEALERDGIVCLEKDRVAVTDIGRLFIRHVGLVFDTYSKTQTDGPKFSRTV